MPFQYQRTVRLAEILNPQKNFESEKQMVEHRLDPLTGNSTVIPSGRFEYVKRLFQTDFQILEKMIKESKINCSFCPKNVREKTPKFPSNLIPEGRIEIDETTVFPSLFAHMDFNAIAVISREHHLRLKEFAPERILNAFRGGVIYLNAVRRINPSVKYAVFAGNYLPPSGSSIFHPHMQILASDQPLHFIKQLHTASRVYASKYSANFWLELLEKERSGERYIGSTGSFEWLAPFAPMKTFEVWGISEKESSMLDLTEESWKNFAEGLGRVLSCYSEEGFTCFNFTLYSGPLGEDSSEYFRVGLRIAPRFGYKHPFINDDWSLQTLLMEGESYELPERVAERMRKYL